LAIISLRRLLGAGKQRRNQLRLGKIVPEALQHLPPHPCGFGRAGLKMLD
jgi:hypothetical protein